MSLNKYRIILLLLISLGFILGVRGQVLDNLAASKNEIIKQQLDSLVNDIPALNKKIDISVTDVPLQEFLRGLANSSGLNLYIDPNLNEKIVNNFSQVRVLDILLFLIAEYDLETKVIGSIIHLYKPPEIKEIKPKVILSYNREEDLLDLEVNNETLENVIRELVKVTEQNIILAPGLDKIPVRGFIKSMPLDLALEKFSYTNQMVINKGEDGIFILEKDPEIIQKNVKADKNNLRKVNKIDPSTYQLKIHHLGRDSLSIIAEDAPLIEIVKEAGYLTSNNYILTSLIDGVTTISANNLSYEELLEYILKGTPYSYRKEDNIFFVGDKDQEELKIQKIIKLQYRAVDTVIAVIPEDLAADLQIKEFKELNSILVSGSRPKVEELEEFITKIDKLVPVISIEVLIIDINKSFSVATGIEAGIGEAPVTTQGTVFPEVDMQLGAESINKLLNSFNGIGWANLGQVNENFYVTLKALEEQGFLNIRSTPLLATLNGHHASLKIGNKEYYMEEQTNLIGTQNPTQTTTTTFKPVDVEMSISILPVVSGDDQITLQVEVNQSDFTERISKYAPPGSVSRNFKSQIRVKNEEMILLGGLEEKRIKETSRGTPLLSRIPVIKWFFSSRSKENSDSKLNIFIKPTIIN